MQGELSGLVGLDIYILYGSDHEAEKILGSHYYLNSVSVQWASLFSLSVHSVWYFVRYSFMIPVTFCSLAPTQSGLCSVKTSVTILIT